MKKLVLSIILIIIFSISSIGYKIFAVSDEMLIASSSADRRLAPGAEEDTTTYGHPQGTEQSENEETNNEQNNSNTQEENQETIPEGENSIENIMSGKNLDTQTLSEIIEYNTRNKKTETLEKSQVELEYITKYQNNENLPKNVIQVIQEGKVGSQEVILKKVYENDQIVEEKQISASTIMSASNKIVQIGTSDLTTNYETKVGDKLYVTTDLLPIRTEPNEAASKIISISRGQGVEVQEIQGAWLKVKYNETIGWAKAECLTYFNKNNDYSTYIIDPLKVVSREEIMGGLDFNMNLAQPSGLSYDQFIRVLSNNSNDTNGVIESNAQYFYLIEQQYNINGIFVASMAVHESNWGRSAMANNKKNLFGYGAYDSDPSGNAYIFSTYAESIDLVARALVKSYLNPKGTVIYNNEIATGSFYNGPTLTGVNTRYATDKNWANCVYKWMTYFYNRI